MRFYSPLLSTKTSVEQHAHRQQPHSLSKQQPPQHVTHLAAEARSMEPEVPTSTAQAEDDALSLLTLATADAAAGAESASSGQMRI